MGYQIIELENPYTIGEDFSGLLANHPGVFAFIGSNSKYDLHHPKLIQMSVYLRGSLSTL